MFICAECKNVTEPRESQHKVVIQKRKVEYPDKSVGWEIVKEVALCSECYENSPFRKER